MSLLFTFSLTVTVVAIPASASSSKTTTKRTTTKRTTTKPTPSPSPAGSDSDPAAHYFVINGTVDAASDHEVLGSSAFPNFAKGAVDNYYSLAHSHVDNSPFAQATASPFDTGPIGQTAAAGNTQQPQYADARWPGRTGKATYGNQGGPYAAAEASEYKATAEASEATSGFNGPRPSTELATPKGFDERLRQALAGWKAKWSGPLGLKKPAPTVTTPTATVSTPAGTVTTPAVTVGVPTPPPVAVPSPPAPPPPLPSTIAPAAAAAPSRSLQSSSGDGGSLLESSTLTMLDPKTDALVTKGESRLGRVSIGGGQIVLEGIHVTASITNDGTPTHKVEVVVGHATIGGVPVTIDHDGVDVAGHRQSLPYQQASDALNTALKNAGIQLFLVAPEIVKGKGKDTDSTCTDASGPPAPTLPNQSGDKDKGNNCAGSTGETGDTTCTTSPSGEAGTTPLPTTTTTRTTTTKTTTTTTTNTTTTSSSGEKGDTCTSSGGQTSSTACPTTSSGEKGTSTTTTTTGGTGTGTGMATDGTDDSSAESVTATGVHVVFKQPVNQPGVPAQYVHHILGEVSVDSLATKAGPLPNLNLSPCGTGGGRSGGTKMSGGGGSASSSSPSASASGSTSSGPGSSSFTGGTASQPASSSTGTAGQTFPARLAAALRKPLWLLLAYLVWQALMIATGWSLWRWHRGGAS